MIFTDKYYFILLLLIPIILYLIWKNTKTNSIKSKAVQDILKVFPFAKLQFIVFLLISSLTFLFYIIIAANPNKTNTKKEIEKNWIDIVLTLDISESMNAEDLKPSRIEAAKNILNKFISKLKTDRVWLVIFAGKPFVSIPLTFDYNVIKQQVKNLSTNQINQNNYQLNWTDIWDAILMASNLFKNKDKNNSKRQKVIILLTDWDANRWVNPIVAAEYAKKLWIKIYTIWIGSPQGWYIKYKVWPFTQYAKIPPLKTKTLQEIATITNWQFFRATDNQTLENIFKQLSQLNKTKVKQKIKVIYIPYYKPFEIILILLLLIYFFMKIRQIKWASQI